MLLRDIYEKNHYCFESGEFNWQEAIRRACKPLQKDGTCDERYPELIIECVKKYGPYIVIVPGVAMPHSTEGAEGTFKTAIAFMRTEKPVSFDDDDPEKSVNTFFTLCSTDPEAHLKNMQQLAVVLSDEKVLEAVKNISKPEDLLEIDKMLA